MSKVSLSRRLAALLEAAEQIDPRATAVHRLPPALRMRYEFWRTECDAIHNRYEREDGPGAAYAAYLATGESVTPPMPRAVATALGLDDAPTIPADASAADVAAIWSRMVEG